MYLRNIATFKKILVLVLFTAFASFAHAEMPAADSTSADSAAIGLLEGWNRFSAGRHGGHCHKCFDRPSCGCRFDACFGSRQRFTMHKRHSES